MGRRLGVIRPMVAGWMRRTFDSRHGQHECQLLLPWLHCNSNLPFFCSFFIARSFRNGLSLFCGRSFLGSICCGRRFPHHYLSDSQECKESTWKTCRRLPCSSLAGELSGDFHLDY
jgi:hypothetical protein